MEFNKENILLKTDPILKQSDLNDFESVKHSQSNYRSHNHYILTNDFMETEFFKSNYNKIIPRNLLEIRDNIIDLHSKVDKTQPLEVEFLNSLLILLVEHIKGGSYIFRFGVGYWSNDVIARTLNKLEEGIKICNVLNQYKDDPETNNFTIEGWNSSILGSLWACLYTGLIDEGMYIVNTLDKFLTKIATYQSNNLVFPEVKLDYIGRHALSLYMVKAQFHLILNETEKAKETFNYITQFHNQKGNNPYFKVWWITGLNRLTEAAIEVYKLEPTEENKNRAMDYYLDSIKTEWLEHTETVRERLLITYMLMTEVLKIKVA